MKYSVGDKDHGKSLLSFLQGKEEALSAKKIKKAIDLGGCHINGKVELFSSRKVVKGEEISLDIVSLQDKQKSLPILFENRNLFACAKPPFVSCKEEELRNLLPEDKKGATFLHRLDKDTSGVLLFAKTKEGEKRGKALFSQREIQKLYLAVVEGSIVKVPEKVDNFLEKKQSYEGQTLYKSGSSGQRAITHFHVWKKGEEASVLLCQPVTGRTHQIRVHLKELGYPIVGDYHYGKRSQKASRQLLHAFQLTFIDPWSKEKVQIRAPVPEDFLSSLRAFGIDTKDKE